MKMLEGNRKFYIVLVSLVFTAGLSAFVIWQIPDQATPLIAAIGANVTAVNTPFMLSNYGENKVKARNGDFRNGKTKL